MFLDRHDAMVVHCDGAAKCGHEVKLLFRGNAGHEIAPLSLVVFGETEQVVHDCDQLARSLQDRPKVSVFLDLVWELPTALVLEKVQSGQHSDVDTATSQVLTGGRQHASLTKA